MNKENIFIFDIVTAFGNNGDLLINKALINTLKKYGKVKVVSSHLPASFLKELHLNDEEQIHSFLGCVLDNIFKNRVFKVGIPGHSLESQPEYISGFLQCIKTAFLRYVLRVRFLRVGTSFGPIPSFKLSVERFKSKMYELYGLRDNESVKMCNSSSMKYFPDLAFLSTDIVETNLNPADNDICFLSFRSKFPDAETSSDYLQKITSKITSFLENSSFRKVVIGYQVVEDKETSLEIFNSLSGLQGIEVVNVEDMLDLKEINEIISKSSLVISNRLHVLLPALISGIPHVALTDIRLHKKIKSLYETIGAGFVLQDVTDEANIEISSYNCKKGLLELSKQQKNIANEILDKTLSKL
ncbi:polysaccharide pyruvyl transferase family protein [Glaciecola sp. MH2013]|uniref:polysaccharide pyruvyl transferase family protein n=1 Tax=Glaciecola sp. MH2013 TaxID=2785524 RepID=UPI0018A04637|nr:polysaccharide pyruvyl transferase family protein [Glaciecola sp. MH2013]MBF7072160.1 polysaccharide pyruvyl transferase family protein [Glaciecola sp. MH2013]